MSTVLVVGLLLVTAALAALVWRMSRLRRLLQTLQQDHAALTAAWKVLPPDAARLLPPGSTLLSIEILNPVALAAQESPFAGTIGSVAPGLIRSIVYKRTAGMLREELLKYGVQAEVRLHGLA